MVAALVDVGAEGRWAESMLDAGPLAAPHLMPVEAANILRRAARRARSPRIPQPWPMDLLQLRIELFAYAPVAQRAWELRGAITAYDAWYVALAEFLDAPLVTLDQRLARAPGPRCAFSIPPPPP